MSTNPLLIALGDALPDIRKQIQVEREKAKQKKMGSELQSIFSSSLPPIEMERKAASTLSNYGYTDQALKLNKEVTKKQSTLNQYEREIRDATAEKSEERLTKIMVKIAGSAKSTDDLINIYKNLPGESAQLLAENLPSGIELRTQDGQALKYVWTKNPNDNEEEIYTVVDPNNQNSPGKYQVGPDGKPMTRKIKKLSVDEVRERAEAKQTIKLEGDAKKQLQTAGTKYNNSPPVVSKKIALEDAKMFRKQLSTIRSNPALSDVMKSKIIRDIGKETRVSNNDITRVGDKSLQARVNRTWETLKSGKTFSKSEVISLLKTLDEIIEDISSNLTRDTNLEMFTQQKQLGLFNVADEDIKSVYSPTFAFIKSVTEGTALTEPEPTKNEVKSSLPFSTLEEGIALYKKRTGKTPNLQAQLKMQKLLGE